MPGHRPAVAPGNVARLKPPGRRARPPFHLLTRPGEASDQPRMPSGCRTAASTPTTAPARPPEPSGGTYRRSSARCRARSAAISGYRSVRRASTSQAERGDLSARCRHVEAPHRLIRSAISGKCGGPPTCRPGFSPARRSASHARPIRRAPRADAPPPNCPAPRPQPAWRGGAATAPGGAVRGAGRRAARAPTARRPRRTSASSSSAPAANTAWSPRRTSSWHR